LNARVHQVADNVCGPLLESEHFTSHFYRDWFNSCMRATSAETTRQLEAKADRYQMFASK
jgi:hypothetical protein